MLKTLTVRLLTILAVLQLIGCFVLAYVAVFTRDAHLSGQFGASALISLIGAVAGGITAAAVSGAWDL
jgi:hypothetical protein